MNDLLELLEHESEAAHAVTPPDAYVAFGAWHRDDLEALIDLGRRETLDDGAVLLRADAADRDLFVVVHGALEAYRKAGPDERRLAVFQPGDVVGEVAFVDGRPRSASVRAIGDSTVLRIRAEDVEALCRVRPELGIRLLREIACILADRLRRATAAL